MSETREVPNPGSDAAIAQGCLCPVLDNAHGAGVYLDSAGKPLFWRRVDCPLHGRPEAGE